MGHGTPWAVHTGQVARWRVREGADIDAILKALKPFEKRTAKGWKKVGNFISISDEIALIMWEMFLIIENS